MQDRPANNPPAQQPPPQQPPHLQPPHLQHSLPPQPPPQQPPGQHPPVAGPGRQVPARDTPGPGEPGSNGTRQRTYRWEDPAVSAAAARELDGMTFFREMIAGRLPPPPIAATLGFGWVSVEPGNVVFEISPAEFHYNPIGSVHGGVYATLCDTACACAVHSMLPAGSYYTSLDLNIKFVRPVTVGSGSLRLLCEGTVSHLGSRTALAQSQLTGPDGKLYAQATSSCLIFRPGG
jgi:uncharacterized protein (TIGR00369 family)